MPQIAVENLVKTFRIAERRSGTWGAVTLQVWKLGVRHYCSTGS